MAWGGWGAGPAGAGSQVGSKVFVGIGLALAAVMSVALARDGKGWEAGVAGAAAIYFALRLFAGLGRRREE
jgi:predicted cobalt transporter CbtA